MEFKITKNAPPIQQWGGRQKGQKEKEFFAQLDSLDIMDLLSIRDAKPASLRSLLTHYKLLHPEMVFKTSIDGDEILIQRLGDQ